MSKDLKCCDSCQKEFTGAKYLIRDRKIWVCQSCYLDIDKF